MRTVTGIQPNMITGIHPYADIYPLLPQEEMEQLAESIKANGLRQPIVITPDGLILDGRNRNAACELAGIAPTTVVYEGDDLAEYVIDANSTRRHMTTGQRAMAQAKLLAAAGWRANGAWRPGSVDLNGSVKINLGTWRNRITEAGVILDYMPDLADDVIAGQLALDAAYQRANERRQAKQAETERRIQEEKQQREAAEYKEKENQRIITELGRKGELGQYYLDKILSDAITPTEAWTLYEKETEEERRAAEERRQSMRDMYVGMARDIETCAHYGSFSDISKSMKDYDPQELELDRNTTRVFTLENLQKARAFIDYLIEWVAE